MEMGMQIILCAVSEDHVLYCDSLAKLCRHCIKVKLALTGSTNFFHFLTVCNTVYFQIRSKNIWLINEIYKKNNGINENFLITQVIYSAA